MDMTDAKAAELIGPALRYAVATAEGLGGELRWCFRDDGSFVNIWTDNHGSYCPDEDWELGGPLIDRHKPWVSPPTDYPDEPIGWDAEIYDEAGNRVIGHAIAAPTALVAVCRAVVLAILGDVVQVPSELLGASQ